MTHDLSRFRPPKGAGEVGEVGPELSERSERSERSLRTTSVLPLLTSPDLSRPLRLTSPRFSERWNDVQPKSVTSTRYHQSTRESGWQSDLLSSHRGAGGPLYPPPPRPIEDLSTGLSTACGRAVDKPVEIQDVTRVTLECMVIRSDEWNRTTAPSIRHTAITS